MPITESYLKSIVGTLNEVRPVTHRKMFGGAGVYQDGVLFACVDNDRIYFKADDLTVGRYEAEGMEKFVYDPKTGASMPYWEVPPKVIADPDTLAEWIDEAVEVARRKKAGKKR